jgi:hypothetical protein
MPKMLQVIANTGAKRCLGRREIRSERRSVVPGMAVTECLYCPTTRDGPFPNAEHVLPQAFGKFDSREGNLTLHNVCPQCNAYFGRHLEQHFGRDTLDAYFRLLAGVKPAEEAAEVGGRRLTFQIEEPGTEFHRSWMSLAYDPERWIVMEAPAQVAFRGREETEWRWYLERDITKERLSEFRTCRFRVYGSPESAVRIAERMEAIGLSSETSLWTDRSEETQDPSFEIVRIEIDDVVLRSVAKIAFNYFAWATEDRLPGFVRREDFAPIRAFIRYGTQPAWNPVSIGDGNVQLADTRTRITSGHVLVVAWPDSRKSPVGNVSLFNQITYVVRFADRVPGIWWELDSGHYFNIRTRKVTKMVGVNPMVLRP